MELSPPYSPAASLSKHRAAPINLASIDLNLLVALDALLRECNVTHAAATVGLSQPAMSRILSRLRGMFDDDLLVRTSSGYVRTRLGDWLHSHLPTTLSAIQMIVSPRIEEADDWLSTVRLAMPDHQALLLGHLVTKRLSQGTKSRELAIEPLAAHALKRLETGDLEMAIGEISSVATGYFQRSLYVDDYACLLRPDHPVADRAWTADDFYDLQHAISTPGGASEADHVADALTMGSQRGHYVASPNTISAALAVVESDLVLTVPRRAATKLATVLHLRMKEPPIDIRPYRVVLLWHERTHRDAEHEWIRSQIAAAASSLITIN